VGFAVIVEAGTASSSSSGIPSSERDFRRGFARLPLEAKVRCHGLRDVATACARKRHGLIDVRSL